MKSDRCVVQLDEAQFELAVGRDEDGVLFAELDGTVWRIEPETGTGATVQRLKLTELTEDGTQGEQRVLVFAQRRTAEGQEVLLDGTVHMARVQDARAVRYARMVKPPAAASKAVIKAQMPGLVVTVQVAVGDQVQKGQTLLTLSAMKLENDIRSPVAGTVSGVHVAANTAVEKGAVLVELE